MDFESIDRLFRRGIVLRENIRRYVKHADMTDEAKSEMITRLYAPCPDWSWVMRTLEGRHVFMCHWVDTRWWKQLFSPRERKASKEIADLRTIRWETQQWLERCNLYAKELTFVPLEW